MRLKIKKILKSDESIIEKKVKVYGWIRTIRDQKSFAFIELNDGSCLANLQGVIDASNSDYSKVIKLTIGSSISLEGTIVKSLGKNQKYELKIEKINIIGLAKEDYPLQKKRHTFEYLRTISHLRPRTNTTSAMLRIRNSLIYHSHKFFQDRDFLYLQTPIITASDTEGAGELFRVTTLDDLRKDPKKDFFKKKTFLTVSGQLNAESFACGMSDVYVFSPAFRAENSHTSRHVAEFWMLEPEFAFGDLNDDIKLATDYIKYMSKVALDENEDDIAFFDKFVEKGLIDRLKDVEKKPFEVISYTDAVKILESSKESFEYDISWGKDLQSEHERYLCEKHFNKPVIVTDYPKDLKAFYMKDNPDGKTVAAMDMLVPKVGEIIGGSQREDDYEVLKKKLEEKKLDLDTYRWYLDLRKYGSVPHAGFGVGFERLVQFITGIENIRDVIAFYRSKGNCDF